MSVETEIIKGFAAIIYTVSLVGLAVFIGVMTDIWIGIVVAIIAAELITTGIEEIRRWKPPEN